MFNPNMMDLMAQFGVRQVDEFDREFWSMHTQAIGMNAYPPYGIHTYSLLQPTPDKMSAILLLHEGIQRPLANGFEKPGGKTRSVLTNLTVEDACIEALLKCMATEDPVDHGEGEDPPDRIFSLGGKVMKLEITSVTLQADRQAESGLDRLRTLALLHTLPHLNKCYLTISLSRRAFKAGERPEGAFSDKNLRAILRTLADRHFRVIVTTLKQSMEYYDVADTPLAIRVMPASFPYRSKFYQKTGYEFINGCQLAIKVPAYVSMIQKCVDEKDIDVNDSLLIVHGIPDKKGMLYPRESSLTSLISQAAMDSLRHPSHIRQLFLMTFPKSVEWYSFGQDKISYRGSFRDEPKSDKPPPGIKTGTYSYEMNIPFFNGPGTISGESPEN